MAESEFFWLIFYATVALGVSFYCSVAEAVLLSVTIPHIQILEKDGHKVAQHLQGMKDDIDRPLAAILSLNTIAHTMGAAGVGAQVNLIFGNEWLGLASAILTILILLFSEIIPKTIGAYYWRGLIPSITFSLHYLVMALSPLVYLLQQVTRLIAPKDQQEPFSRKELMAMTELGLDSGSLSKSEFKIINNLFELRQIKLREVMTPRTVIFSVSRQITVEEFFFQSMKNRFSRIPLYDKHSTDIVGFVLRSDLLLAQARGNSDELLEKYMRQLPVLLSSMSVLHALNQITSEETQIALVINEYGDIEGIVTLEDTLETLLGLEIVDESDTIDNMHKLAKRYVKRRESLQQRRD